MYCTVLPQLCPEEAPASHGGGPLGLLAPTSLPLPLFFVDRALTARDGTPEPLRYYEGPCRNKQPGEGTPGPQEARGRLGLGPLRSPLG